MTMVAGWDQEDVASATKQEVDEAAAGRRPLVALVVGRVVDVPRHNTGRFVLSEADPDTAPIDKEVIAIVDGLKRSLSKRNMRYVVRELLRALGQG